ncbi:MAG: cytochrome b/b6 domain-containing protein [Pseudomonadota bacterium]
MIRYHPLLVALHWIMAFMILIALAAGGLVLADMPNANPEKLNVLAGHMTVGMVIGGLLVVRLATQLMTTMPPKATTGSTFLDRIGNLTHWAFYILVSGMVLSGLATAFGANMFPIVFWTSGDPLPDSFGNLPQRAAHGLIALCLIALIALHIATAVYHQLVLKDSILSRMWFGKRT